MTKKFLIEILKQVYDLPSSFKISIIFFVDFFFCFFSVWIAYYLRIGEFINLNELSYGHIIFCLVTFYIIFFYIGLYNTIFRYSIDLKLLSGLLIYFIVSIILFTIFGIDGIPRSIGIIQPILLGFLVLVFRFSINRIFFALNINSKVKTIIYGAGKAGIQLGQSIKNSHDLNFFGYFDDDNSLHGKIINGERVYNPNDSEKVIKQNNITNILLATPSINKTKRKEIITRFEKLPVRVKTIPNLSEILSGKMEISEIKDLDLDDILDRKIVISDYEKIDSKIKNKNILVTGGGGSIGSELCRKIFEFKPHNLIILEINEYNLYLIYEELNEIKSHFPENKVNIIPLLCNILDKTSLDRHLKEYRIDIIFHAAAYKHVNLVEKNKFEGIKNNFFGTSNLIESAIENNISEFVFISSDKAVRPTNIMGATKRLSEMQLQSTSEYNPKIKISIVRFGNIIGSSGSVIPKFRNQIQKGGPVTVTHPKVKRFFMTKSEAALLVLQTLVLSKGGEIFVLDMGEQIYIYDLAKKMINLFGYKVKDHNNPTGDISISITGLLPGEKLYEELFLGNELENTSHEKIKKANEPSLPLDRLNNEISKLRLILDNKKEEDLIKFLEGNVNGYTKSH